MNQKGLKRTGGVFCNLRMGQHIMHMLLSIEASKHGIRAATVFIQGADMRAFEDSTERRKKVPSAAVDDNLIWGP